MSAEAAMANVIAFDVRRSDRDGPTIITPCIDGVPLPTLVEQFERANGLTDPAGGYGGLIPEHFNYGPLDRYFLGESESSWFASTPGRIYILGCECGEVGCWPLVCRVRIRDGAVTWEDFEQPHRPQRDYSSFGPFVFDAAQYRAALHTLRTS